VFVELARAASPYVTAVSVVSLVALLFAYTINRHRVRTLREDIVGDAPIPPQTLVAVLKEFERDEHRLRALKEILRSADAATAIVSRARGADTQLQRAESNAHQIAFAVVVGVCFLLLGLVGILARTQDRSPPPEALPSNRSAGVSGPPVSSPITRLPSTSAWLPPPAVSATSVRAPSIESRSATNPDPGVSKQDLCMERFHQCAKTRPLADCTTEAVACQRR
jgi:hypothetical protein